VYNGYMETQMMFRNIPSGMGRPDMGQWGRPICAPKAGTKGK